MAQYTDEEWAERVSVNDYPEPVRRAIRRVYESYPKDCMPKGICDPAYIMNILAFELGFGDGQGNFWFPAQEDNK